MTRKKPVQFVSSWKWILYVVIPFISVEPELSMTFDGKAVKRNNNEYLGIENSKLTFKVKKYVKTFQTVQTIRNFYFCCRIIFNFHNLYNGDKLLGDTTNRFLNENWSDIFKEIQDNIFDAFTLIAENTLRNVFNKVPYNDLFAPKQWPYSAHLMENHSIVNSNQTCLHSKNSWNLWYAFVNKQIFG